MGFVFNDGYVSYERVFFSHGFEFLVCREAWCLVLVELSLQLKNAEPQSVRHAWRCRLFIAKTLVLSCGVGVSVE